MILVGNQRGHGRDLALHLMNARDNEHVTLHAMRGFVADDLEGAFKEVEAISLGTKCKQYLFSLSLNPPPDADVPIAVFEEAIEEIEAALGLAGQPRAVVFHEKKGRRHAHCVWSRIDPGVMKAVNLPHYKRRLQRVAQELYRRHGWDMPEGFVDATNRDPNAFDQTEAAQAGKASRDPKDLKRAFREAWERSDSLAAFRAALLAEGFVLAQGARRAFAAVDADGKVYSLSRWTGAGAKALRSRLGLPVGLPSIDEARAQFCEAEPREAPRSNNDLSELVGRQRQERVALADRQRVEAETARAARRASLPTGLKAAWAKLTGQYDRLVERLENEAADISARHRAEADALIARHLQERKAHQSKAEHQRAFDDLLRDAAHPPEAVPFFRTGLQRF